MITVNEIAMMFENLNVAILASDENFKIIFQNEKCKQLFGNVFNKGDYIGCDANECHSEGTTQKIRTYFEEYKSRKRELDYYVTEEPTGKITVVNFPFYEGDKFKGVVEFIFESKLG